MSATLDKFQRVGWKNKRAWSLLRRAKPFLLDCKEGLFFVQSDGFATPIDEDGRPTGKAVAAVKLLDPAKRPAGR